MIKTEVDNDKMYAIIDHNIENTMEDINDLVEIQHEFINNNCKYLIFKFTDCQKINAAVSVIIGTLPEYIKEHKKFVKYRFTEKENNPVFKFMKSVGMYKYFTKNEIDYTDIDVIPFNHIRDEERMQEYVDRIMTLAPIRMQKEAQDILASYIYEIYQNGLYHAKSPIGVYTSGIWDKDNKEFTFSIYDMGVGIPSNVRQYICVEEADSIKCLRIAFIEGFSTSSETDINRGLGLARLEKFINLNEGSMSIYSEDCCCIIENGNEKNYYKLKRPIKGTLIIINIAADENNIYVVEEERNYE